jgi:hypothetical protein
MFYLPQYIKNTISIYDQQLKIIGYFTSLFSFSVFETRSLHMQLLSIGSSHVSIVQQSLGATEMDSVNLGS